MTKLIKMIDENLFEQLSIVFGEKKAKQLIKEIKEIKNKNPNIAYNFIFSEDGKITAIEKKEKESYYP